MNCLSGKISFLLRKDGTLLELGCETHIQEKILVRKEGSWYQYEGCKYWRCHYY